MADKKKKEEINEELILDEEATKEMEDNDQVESPEEVEKEVKKHEEEPKSKEEILAEELEDYKDKYLRPVTPSFENFRRRTNKEKYDIIAQANEKLLGDILPVVDDFERANKVHEESKDLEAHVKGIELIYKKLKSTLESKGIKKMEALGKDFDAEVHEAITQIPVENKKQRGKVVDVIEEGYYLNDKVLRFAKVVVGQGG